MPSARSTLEQIFGGGDGGSSGAATVEAPALSAPTRSSGTFRMGGGGAMIDISRLAEMPVGLDSDFSPVDPGSYEIQESAPYRELLGDMHSVFDAQVAQNLDLLAAQRESQIEHLQVGCRAAVALAKADADIAIAKLGARDGVAAQQYRRNEAMVGSLKNQLGLAEKYNELGFEAQAAVGKTAHNIRKTAAQYGQMFQEALGR